MIRSIEMKSPTVYDRRHTTGVACTSVALKVGCKGCERRVNINRRLRCTPCPFSPRKKLVRRTGSVFNAVICPKTGISHHSALVWEPWSRAIRWVKVYLTLRQQQMVVMWWSIAMTKTLGGNFSTSCWSAGCYNHISRCRRCGSRPRSPRVF